ncbi:hypothetical protein [Lapillicoccus sp.]|uniref:hypothetical protein n=1 Tax=Lapillicoccus sp. TaxID=1909287 RepID=UPI003982E825
MGLSVTQVLGSALAAVTAALAASFLGVAGTIIGALVGSLVATVGSAVYAHSLSTAGARLRIVRVVTTPGPAPAPCPAPVAPQTPRTSVPERDQRARPTLWLRVVAGLVAGAALALGGITLVEQVIGHPLSGAASSGTSIGNVVTLTTPHQVASVAPADRSPGDSAVTTATPTIRPSEATTATGTATGTGTVTPSPTATTSPAAPPAPSAPPALSAPPPASAPPAASAPPPAPAPATPTPSSAAGGTATGVAAPAR